MSKQQNWNKRYAERPLIWSAGPNELLTVELATLSPARALDVACGEGRNALWLADQGWQVSGVDFSAVAIDKARAIARRRNLEVDWTVLDVAEQELPAETFDLVCVLYLHTDETERKRWLPMVVDAVAPGGTFLYIGHDPSNIDAGVGGPQNPALLLDCESLVAALAGFTIETARVVKRAVNGEPGHGEDLVGVALDTCVRAVRNPN